jgi:hypothetical protein
MFACEGHVSKTATCMQRLKSAREAHARNRAVQEEATFRLKVNQASPKRAPEGDSRLGGVSRVVGGGWQAWLQHQLKGNSPCGDRVTCGRKAVLRRLLNTDDALKGVAVGSSPVPRPRPGPPPSRRQKGLPISEGLIVAIAALSGLLFLVLTIVLVWCGVRKHQVRARDRLREREEKKQRANPKVPSPAFYSSSADITSLVKEICHHCKQPHV